MEWNGNTHEQMDNFYDRGDVNSDQTVDLDDARSVLRIALSLDIADAIQTLAADMNGDGRVTIKDARKILRAVLNIESI